MERFGPSLVLLDKLAAGGMAEVYRAKQLGHGGFEKIVAVKRILPQYAESEDFKEMFLQEASLSAHLQHPNVIQTYSNGEVGGYLYLTMEFVDGKNLRQILAKIDRQKKRLPIEYALYVIAEAAKGMHYAHEYVDERSGQAMNIVHRDMSPQNVMLGYDGTVKIVDFGIAKMAAQAESTRAGVLKGKFGYMSPEQARGMQLDRRTDIFALGIILFEVLTQRRLFASDDDMRTLRLVKECRIPRASKYNPSIGPKLDQIVLKALAKEKSERYGAALELYEDLQRLLQELYPKFIPSDFSKFLRNTFLEEIREDKQKREKLHREAPALLDNSRYDERVDQESGRKDSKRDNPAEGGRTMIEEDQATQISNAMSGVEGLEVPELGDSSQHHGTSGGDASFRAPHSGEPKISQLQLESSRAGVVLHSERDQAGLADLPRSNDFANLSIQKTSFGVAPESPYMEVSHQQRGAPRSHKRSGGSAKTRRLAYVSLILIGVVFYLSQNDSKTVVAPEVATSMSNPSKIETQTPESEVVAKVEVPAEVPSAPVDEVALSPAPEPSRAQASEPSDEPAPVAVTTPAAIKQPEPSASAAAVVVPSRAPSNAAPDDSAVDEENAEGGLAGYLSISSYPRSDRIMVNGQLMRNKSGEPLTSPVTNIELTPGVYEISLQNTTYNVSWSGRIRIRSQKISPLHDVVLK